MIDKLVKLQNQRFFTHTFLLFIGQGFTLLSTLAVNFILAKRLSVEAYGKVSFALYLISFLSILIDFGFNITAVREIAVFSKEKLKRNDIFNKVFSCKIYLLIAASLILIGLLLIPKVYDNKWYFFFGYIILVSKSLNTSWYFQGIQNFSHIAIGLVSAALIYIGLVFFSVHTDLEAVYANFIFGLSQLFFSGYLIFQLIFREKLQFKLIRLKDGITEIKLSSQVFFSNLAILFQSSFGAVLLGILGEFEVLGFYSMAEKLISILKQIIGTISIILFPKLCINFESSEKSGFDFIQLIFKLLFILFFIISFSLFIYNDQIISILYSKNNENTKIMLKILAFTPLFTVLNVPFYLYLLYKKMYSLVFKINLSLAVLSLTLSLILISINKLYGLAYSILIVDLLTLGTYYYIYKLKK